MAQAPALSAPGTCAVGTPTRAQGPEQAHALHVAARAIARMSRHDVDMGEPYNRFSGQRRERLTRSEVTRYGEPR
jgi:hypothetical protein